MPYAQAQQRLLSAACSLYHRLAARWAPGHSDNMMTASSASRKQLGSIFARTFSSELHALRFRDECFLKWQSNLTRYRCRDLISRHFYCSARSGARAIAGHFRDSARETTSSSYAGSLHVPPISRDAYDGPRATYTLTVGPRRLRKITRVIGAIPRQPCSRRCYFQSCSVLTHRARCRCLSRWPRNAGDTRRFARCVIRAKDITGRDKYDYISGVSFPH